MITEQDILQKIRDDLYLTGKQKVMDFLPENQNALFVGKFRIPTKAHINMIETALKEFNKVVICIVKAKKNPKQSLSLETQEKIFETIFGNKVSIITHSSGNLTSIINKSPKKIRFLLAGTDRIVGYKKQLERFPNINLVETTRDENSDENISATKLIKYIEDDNISQFKKLTHKKMWSMFDNIKKELND